MNPWIDVVESLACRGARLEAMRALAGGDLGARASRGRPLSRDRVDALVWGLSHESPVVRRCCVELLDLHPDARAAPGDRPLSRRSRASRPLARRPHSPARSVRRVVRTSMHR